MKCVYTKIFVIILFSFVGRQCVLSQALSPIPPPSGSVDEVQFLPSPPDGPPSPVNEDWISDQYGQERPRARRPGAQAQPEILYLTPEQEEEVIAYLRKARPDRVDHLLDLKGKRPGLYRSFLSRAYREMRYLNRLKEDDPERYEQVAQEKKFEEEARLLAKKYRDSEDENEKVRLREDLKTLLDKLFDYRQMNRQFEIEKLEKRLEDLKDVNERRLANKEEIVERRLDEMLGTKRELEW
jgi:hypothetical protein